MRIFDLIAILLTLTAALSYVNFRWLKLPTTIGLMVLTLVCTIPIIVLGQFVPSIEAGGKALVERLDFDQVLLHGMLGFLLFAGALHINLNDIARWKVPIMVLSTLGVLLSTAIVGGLLWVILPWMGLEVRLIWCLLFGAL
ncbi:MAG: cation:proton antiporter, partial [Planctomycetia bacterium]|nr:cation:proton antiporter [Planctomycetia bacterium]